MDQYAIDSHKLIYHPTRIAQFFEAKEDIEKLKNIYPIYVEVSPYGGCNHRCTFCGVDYMGYQKIALEEDLLKNRLSEMAKLGVKSVMFAGEGEPLLYTNLDNVIEHCASIGLDTSITTNFVPTNSKNLTKFIQHASWIKVSINAGSRETYAKVHQTKEIDFDRVLENLATAVALKREYNYNCTIGAQMLLLPENAHEAATLARVCRDIGIDYLVIKPYSQHLFSNTKKYENVDYNSFDDLSNELKQFNSDSFNVVVRTNTMKKYTQKEHPYKKCLSTPYFWGYIASDGDVYGCSAYLGQEKFCYGNIKEKSFEDIWLSKEREASINYVNNELDISNCRVNCRMDEVNRYLWRLQNPNQHDNFI